MRGSDPVIMAAGVTGQPERVQDARGSRTPRTLQPGVGSCRCLQVQHVTELAVQCCHCWGVLLIRHATAWTFWSTEAKWPSRLWTEQLRLGPGWERQQAHRLALQRGHRLCGVLGLPEADKSILPPWEGHHILQAAVGLEHNLEQRAVGLLLQVAHPQEAADGSCMAWPAKQQAVCTEYRPSTAGACSVQPCGDTPDAQRRGQTLGHVTRARSRDGLQAPLAGPADGHSMLAQRADWKARFTQQASPSCSSHAARRGLPGSCSPTASRSRRSSSSAAAALDACRNCC